MARHPAEPLKSRDIRGVKYVERLLPMLDALHEVGCDRDKAGNRRLFYNQYWMLVLLSLFNPVVRSLRAIQQVSELSNVQRKLGCSRASMGSLSEAVKVFDPSRLLGIIDSLVAEVKPVRDVRKDHLAHALTAVDGSVVKTLKSITEAAFMGDKNGESHSGWRLHTHFDIDRHVPTRIDVTPASNSGKNDEKNRLEFRGEFQGHHIYLQAFVVSRTPYLSPGIACLSRHWVWPSADFSGIPITERGALPRGVGHQHRSRPADDVSKLRGQPGDLARRDSPQVANTEGGT